jgi:8-oxo-dGTP pyrophosphatase MutT (NUDIX family)
MNVAHHAIVDRVPLLLSSWHRRRASVLTPELAYGRHSGPAPADARRCAVLVLLYPHSASSNESVPADVASQRSPPDAAPRVGAPGVPEVRRVLYDLHTLLTLRADQVTHHSGQVSFPGGGLEPGESYEEAALREWHEELGPLPADVRWLGRLPELYVFRSNNVITACLAYSQTRPPSQPNPSEVARVLELPVGALGDPGLQGWHWQQRGALRFRAPHICWNDHLIWGATAILCREVYELLAQSALQGLRAE